MILIYGNFFLCANNVFVEHFLDVLFICLCSWVRHIYWNFTKEHISFVPNLKHGLQCIMHFCHVETSNYVSAE